MTIQNENQIATVSEDQAVELLDQQSYKPSFEVVKEDANYRIIRDKDGNYAKKAKFHDFSSFKAETREDRVWLMGLFDSDEGDENNAGLKNHIGKVIEVQDIILKTYDTVDEKTGDPVYGVNTYLITPERQAYITSSKSVYFKVLEIFEYFGVPGSEDWQNVKVKVSKKKRENGEQILIKVVG